jgi:glutamate-1-semialdehyde 2,1-aminomutase
MIGKDYELKLPELTNTDRFIYDNEIKPYLPHRVFDAHTHIQIPKFHPDLEIEMPLTKNPLFHDIDMEVLKSWWEILFPDAAVRGLILGMPTKECDIRGVNQYMAQHIDTNTYRFSILTGPQLSDNELEQQIIQYKPHGLKPYMCFSRKQNHNESGISDLISESQIALADKYRLAITLHVAKPRGMADTDNLKEINRLVKAYPHCNFILAHCGRCFIAPNMERALKSLSAAENLWFDTSAVCDTGVFLYLLSGYDKQRILFGTDLVTASGFRGTYVRMGMSWDWSCQENVQRPNGQDIRATFAAYENLCAFFHAAKFCKLSKSDFDNIFFNNAAKLFKILPV